MSAYNQFVKEQMAKMRDDPMPAKDKMKIIGKLWTSKKGKKGGYVRDFRIPKPDRMYSQVIYTPTGAGRSKKSVHSGSGFGLLW